MEAAAMKHSAQRDAVREYLKSTKTHPSAEMVYEEVRKQFPKISLATVYRNLSLLVELGEAKKVATVEGNDRFDADTSEHYHFICEECNAVLDLEVPFAAQLDVEAGRNFAGTITGHEVIFHGICPECKKHYVTGGPVKISAK